MKLEIEPVPLPPQVGNQAICQNVVFNLEKSVKASDALLWYDSVADTTGDKIAPKIDLNKSGKTTFYVSQVTQSGCESERKTFDSTISTISAKSVLDDISYCRNMPNATSTDKENQLIWFASLTSKTPFANMPIPNTKTDCVTNYFVSAKNTAGCESVRVPLKVSVKKLIINLFVYVINEFLTTINQKMFSVAP